MTGKPGAGRADKKAGAATTLYLNQTTWQAYKKCVAVLRKSGSARVQELMDRDLLGITKPPAAALLYWKELQVLLNGKLDPKLVEAVLAVIDKEIAENPEAAAVVRRTVNLEGLELEFKRQMKIAQDTKAMMKREGVLDEASRLALSLGLSPDRDRSNAGDVVQKLLTNRDNTAAVELLIQHLQALAVRNELKGKIREARLEKKKEEERLRKAAGSQYSYFSTDESW
jgi:hypothetical protein